MGHRLLRFHSNVLQLAGLQRLERQVGIDRAGAVADQQREVHHLARLTRFDNQRHLRARLLAHQVIVHGGERQQAGNRRVVLVQATVGKNQQRIAGLNSERSAPAELVERALQAALTFLNRKKHGQRRGQETALRNAAQPFQIPVGEDGMRQAQGVAVLRRFGQDVPLGADIADQRHHHLFADGVDRRIGDLGEKLLEVVEQRLRLVGKTGQRRIGAHRADRLLTLGGHRAEDHLQIFIRVAEGALPLQKRVPLGAILAWRLGQFVNVDLVLLDPKLVRIAAVKVGLEFFVGNDAAAHGVDQQHFPRLQTALELHILGLHG